MYTQFFDPPPPRLFQTLDPSLIINVGRYFISCHEEGKLGADEWVGYAGEHGYLLCRLVSPNGRQLRQQ